MQYRETSSVLVGNIFGEGIKSWRISRAEIVHPNDPLNGKLVEPIILLSFTAVAAGTHHFASLIAICIS